MGRRIFGKHILDGTIKNVDIGDVNDEKVLIDTVSGIDTLEEFVEWTEIQINDLDDTKFDKIGGLIAGDVAIQGNLIVSGDHLEQLPQTVIIEDNMLVLNHGESYAGILAGQAGLEFDRGTELNYQIIFDESTQTVRLGERETFGDESGESGFGESGGESTIDNTQAVATREDDPYGSGTVHGIPYWDDVTKKFLTNSRFKYDSSNNNVTLDTDGDIIFSADNGIRWDDEAYINLGVTNLLTVHHDAGIDITSEVSGSFLSLIRVGLGGRIELVTSGSFDDVKINSNPFLLDNKKLSFGTDKDAYLQWNTSTTPESLTMNPYGKWEVQGNSIQFRHPSDKSFWIGNDASVWKWWVGANPAGTAYIAGGADLNGGTDGSEISLGQGFITINDYPSPIVTTINGSTNPLITFDGATDDDITIYGETPLNFNNNNSSIHWNSTVNALELDSSIFIDIDSYILTFDENFDSGIYGSGTENITFYAEGTKYGGFQFDIDDSNEFILNGGDDTLFAINQGRTSMDLIYYKYQSLYGVGKAFEYSSDEDKWYFDSNIHLYDDTKLYFGTGDDMEIYHNNVSGLSLIFANSLTLADSTSYVRGIDIYKGGNENTFSMYADRGVVSKATALNVVGNDVTNEGYIKANNNSGDVDFIVRKDSAVDDADAIKYDAGTDQLDLNTTVKVNNNNIHEVVSPPASSSSTGRVGQTAYDSNYFYICTATDTWKRIPLDLADSGW